MRLTHLLGIVTVAVLGIATVHAAETTMTPGMMPGSMVMATMPDGHMGSMPMTDDATMTKMMGMGTPVSNCTMMMSDKDGKMSMIDTTSAEAKAECEKVAMMAPSSANDDAMKATPGMMPANMVMAMMPDGHMGSMMADDAMATQMMGMAKPVTGCMLTVTDKDGKMSVVDTSSADAMAECEKVAKMTPSM